MMELVIAEARARAKEDLGSDDDASTLKVLALMLIVATAGYTPGHPRQYDGVARPFNPTAIEAAASKAAL